MEHFFSSNSGADQKKRSSPKIKHFFSPNSGESQKKKRNEKGLHQKWNTFFSPNSSGDLRSDADQSQIITGDADVAILKLLGEIQSNYWGVLSPRVLAPLDL